MSEDVINNDLSKKLEKNYDLIKKVYKKRTYFSVIQVILFIFLISSLPPLFPNYLANLFNLTISGHFLYWLSMIFLFFILFYLSIRFKPSITEKELSFFILKRENQKIENILLERERNPKAKIKNRRIKKNINKVILGLDETIDDLKYAPGFDKTDYFNKLETMARRLKDRLIPNLNKEYELEQVSKIINKCSEFFLLGEIETLDLISETTRKMPTVEAVKIKKMISLENLLTSKNIIVCFLSWLVLLSIIGGVATAIILQYGEIPIIYIHQAIIPVIVGAGLISATLTATGKKHRGH